MKIKLARQLFDASDFGIILLTPEAKIALWNDWMARASGVAGKDALGRSLEEVFPGAVSSRIKRAISNALDQGMPSLLSRNLKKNPLPLYRIASKKGETTFMEQQITVKPLPSEDGRRHGLIQITDITLAVRRELDLKLHARTTEAIVEGYRLSEQRTHAIVDNALDAIITFDEDGVIVTFNPAAERAFGFKAERIIGKNIETLLQWEPESHAPGDVTPGGRWLRLAEGREVRECAGHRRNGDVFSMELSVGLMEVDGHRMFIAMARDISRRKQAEKRIQYLAHYDTLTGMPNRALLQERLSQAVIQAKRTGGLFGLMMLDLDNFKEVNDTLGHQVGDLLLVESAKRISAVVRESDTLARQGGDEFIVLLTNLADRDGVSTVAKSIVKTMDKPFVLQDCEVKSSVSIGVTIFPNDGEDTGQLLKNADLALYRAKAKGRNTFQLYVPEMDAKVQAHKTMEQELRQALETGRLALHYQPLVNANNGVISGVEALVRWNHVRRGNIVAREFIPFIARTELMAPLGEWVIRQACAQARLWRDAGLPPVPVSVNLTSGELCRKNLAGGVAGALHDAGLEESALRLEFGEDAFFLAVERNPKALAELREMGVGLSIDNFGAGASTLDYLRGHPVDQIKIDPSYLKKVGDTVRGAALFAAMVELGHSLGSTIDVEGVETFQQFEFVLRNNVEEMQGFYLSHPVTPDAMTDMLRLGKPLATMDVTRLFRG